MKKIYCVPNWEEIEAYLDFSKQYNAGFEYNEFYNPDLLDRTEDLKRLICDYKGLGRDLSLDTLHGAFLDISINSSDKRIQKACRYRVEQSMEIASELGVKAVIFHTNYIVNFHLASYEKEWLYRNESYWRKLLEKYQGLEIYIENMFDVSPRLLSCLAKSMADEPRFGVCYDFAHGNISGLCQEEWIRQLSPYIRHIHINDNNGFEDSHKAVGDGTIPWELFGTFMEKIEGMPSVLIEVGGMEKLEKSIWYMKQKGMYPFDTLCKEALCEK